MVRTPTHVIGIQLIVYTTSPYSSIDCSLSTCFPSALISEPSTNRRGFRDRAAVSRGRPAPTPRIRAARPRHPRAPSTPPRHPSASLPLPRRAAASASTPRRRRRRRQQQHRRLCGTRTVSLRIRNTTTATTATVDTATKPTNTTTARIAAGRAASTSRCPSTSTGPCGSIAGPPGSGPGPAPRSTPSAPTSSTRG